MHYLDVNSHLSKKRRRTLERGENAKTGSSTCDAVVVVIFAFFFFNRRKQPRDSIHTISLAYFNAINF